VNNGQEEQQERLPEIGDWVTLHEKTGPIAASIEAVWGYGVSSRPALTVITSNDRRAVAQYGTGIDEWTEYTG
jgi:hypothetical protein